VAPPGVPRNEYANFASQVRAALSEVDVVPRNMRINHAAPEIVSSLSTGFRTMEAVTA
jgi:hypothetical protein